MRKTDRYKQLLQKPLFHLLSICFLILLTSCQDTQEDWLENGLWRVRTINVKASMPGKEAKSWKHKNIGYYDFTNDGSGTFKSENEAFESYAFSWVYDEQQAVLALTDKNKGSVEKLNVLESGPDRQFWVLVETEKLFSENDSLDAETLGLSEKVTTEIRIDLINQKE